MRTRTIDPDVARCRGVLAGLTSQGASQTVIDKARRDLESAKTVAAVKAIRDSPPALSPEIFTSVVAALAGAVVTDA